MFTASVCDWQDTRRQDSSADSNYSVTYRLIVPNVCCGSLIGKSGANIKELREVSQFKEIFWGCPRCCGVLYLFCILCVLYAYWASLGYAWNCFCVIKYLFFRIIWVCFLSISTCLIGIYMLFFRNWWGSSYWICFLSVWMRLSGFTCLGIWIVHVVVSSL